SEGFTGEVVAKVPTAEETKAAEEKAVADQAAAKVAEDEVAAKAAAEPKLAQITEPQFLDLVKKANSVTELNAALQRVRDESAGRIGSLQELVKKLQEATPSGVSVDVADSDFSELMTEIPDIAPKLITGLKRVLGKIKGTGPVVPSVTVAEIDARVETIATKRIAETLVARDQKRAMDDVTKQHKDWQTEIGSVNSKTEFRQWMETQPHAYAETFYSSWEPDVVAEALTKFHDFKKAKSALVVESKPVVPAPSAKEQRLKEAVPPKGGVVVPAKPKQKTPEEEFAEGFTS
ncbi:MAG: hypothetical protein ACRD2L_19080, partial [Terriglobia bacterium]